MESPSDPQAPVIWAWLSEVENPKPQDPPNIDRRVPKRQPLVPSHGNMNRDIRRSPRRRLGAAEQAPSQGDDQAAREKSGMPKESDRGRKGKRMPISRFQQKSTIDAAEAPIASATRAYTNALSQNNIALCATPSISSASSGVATRRSTSPIKGLGDLRTLNKPVHYGMLDLYTDNLPEEIQSLLKDLWAICNNEKIVPAEIWHDVPIPEMLRKDEWKTIPKPKEVGPAREQFDLKFELEVLVTVRSEAGSLSANSDHESQWYCSVIWPLLSAAFKGHQHIQPKIISHARLIPDCGPQSGEQYTRSRLVDFAVNIMPRDVTDKDMTAWLISQPDHLRSVNQTLYTPLIRSPTFLPMEAKVSGADQEAKTQIGAWISAWHERVALLKEVRSTEMTDLIITLPAIIVSGHSWSLYFALDRGTHIDILQFTTSIGDTLSILGMYRILAVLRRLGTWALEEFDPWFKRTFLDRDK